MLALLSTREQTNNPTMPQITIQIGANYSKELKARLDKYSITQGELARESGTSASQVSRWITTGAIPRMENIQRIETAIINIRRRRQGREPLP